MRQLINRGKLSSLRDKSRDALTERLNSLGISAEMAERGRAEETVESLRIFKQSLGLVDVSKSPIASINVLKKNGGKDSPPQWWFVFLVPYDTTAGQRWKLKIKPVRKKSFPLFGKVLEVYWKGNDQGTGLVNDLSEDKEIDSLVTRRGNLLVRAHSKHFHGWGIQTKRFVMTTEDWKALEHLAERLQHVSSSPVLRSRLTQA